MKRAQRLITAITLVLSISCGKAPEEPQYGNNIDSSINTQRDGIRVKEIKSSLNCQVNIQNQLKDQFVWENPSELSLVKILNYRIGSKDTSFIIRLEESLQNKTEIKLLYLRTTKNVLNNGSIHDRSLYRPTTIHENLETKIYDNNSETISCILKRFIP